MAFESTYGSRSRVRGHLKHQSALFLYFMSQKLSYQECRIYKISIKKVEVQINN